MLVYALQLCFHCAFTKVVYPTSRYLVNLLNSVKMDVSRRLISLRERCGFTQNGLAERAGVSQTHLRRVELGQADITVGHLQLLCDAMNISLQDFFEQDSNADEITAAFSKLSPKQKHFSFLFLRAYKKMKRATVWSLFCNLALFLRTSRIWRSLSYCL